MFHKRYDDYSSVLNDDKNDKRYIITLTARGKTAYAREIIYECFLSILLLTRDKMNFNFSDGDKYDKSTILVKHNSDNDGYPNQVTCRYSAEYRMTEKEFDLLCESIYSNWHGNKTANPNKVKHANQILKEKLIGIYLDVYNPKRQFWERDREISLKTPRSNFNIGWCSVM